MRLGVKCDYTFIQSYSGFLEGKQIRELKGDLLSSLVAEYLMSRYTYGIGTTKFLKKKIQNHTDNYINNNIFDEEGMKEMIQLF